MWPKVALNPGAGITGMYHYVKLLTFWKLLFKNQIILKTHFGSKITIVLLLLIQSFILCSTSVTGLRLEKTRLQLLPGYGAVLYRRRVGTDTTLVSSAVWTSLFLLPAYIICCSGLHPGRHSTETEVALGRVVASITFVFHKGLVRIPFATKFTKALL